MENRRSTIDGRSVSTPFSEQVGGTGKLPGATGIGSVTLNVSDPDRTRALYEEVLGFQNCSRVEGTETLAAPGGGPPLLYLRKAVPNKSAARRSAGLFHVAYLLPSRAALGAVLSRIIAAGYPMQGAADHMVSEALYLADPEGNGIELYVDRPRTAWQWKNGEVAMATDPLDLRSLLEEASTSWTGGNTLPPETVIGHVHLQIGDLGRGEEVYNGLLGFDVTQRSYPGALFLSAGGYHHHIGLNIWGGRGIPPRREGERGLASFRITVPDINMFNAIAARADCRTCGPANTAPLARLTDNDGITVEIEGPHF